MEKRIGELRTMALASRSAGQTLPDTAATRFVEEETRPLLIVRELGREHCMLADGRHFRFDEAKASGERRREISAMLFGNIVRVRSKDLALPQPVNRSAEKRRLFERWLPVKENYEGIFLAKLRPDGALEDLCSTGEGAGFYESSIGWEKERPVP